MKFFDKKYRGSFEIIATILEVASNGASRFTIARRSKTSYVLLRKYLTHLVKVGFITVEIDKKQTLYKTCERGLEFLRLYYALLKMLSSNTSETQMFVRERQAVKVLR